ncbi:MAG: hypothetical protein GTO08_01185 [Deltaproteobacteria bacterium]|nr:hypothetical protein [Deltaproteobacteria bacterium]
MFRLLIIFFATISVMATPYGVSQSHGATYISESDKVFRIREVKGEVWLRTGPGNEGTEVYENMPLTEGYGIVTGPGGFVDIEVDSETFVRMGEGSEISLREVGHDRLLMEHIAGRVYASRLGESSRWAITFAFGFDGMLDFTGQGAFRIDDGTHGTINVSVREGRITLRAEGKEYLVREGEMAMLGEGVRLSRAYGKDSWDQLNEKRDNEVLALSGGGYIQDVVAGRHDMEKYGEWVEVPVYGYAWRPLVVVSGWAPFRYGRWVFLSPFGWTWVSLEPWGWITYHYGNWVTTSHHGWVWVPSTQYRHWYPARARLIVESRGIRWVPLRFGERIAVYDTILLKRKYAHVINRRAIFSRPVVIKRRNRYVVKEYRPLRYERKRKLIPYRKDLKKRRESPENLIKRRTYRDRSENYRRHQGNVTKIKERRAVYQREDQRGKKARGVKPERWSDSKRGAVIGIGKGEKRVEKLRNAKRSERVSFIREDNDRRKSQTTALKKNFRFERQKVRVNAPKAKEKGDMKRMRRTKRNLFNRGAELKRASRF